MPDFSVSKSIVIDAPVEEVFDFIRDFKTWPEWSPWMVAEPDCSLTYDSGGKGYRWEGDIIGSGGMNIVGEDRPGRIDYDLQFIKPWKSRADVSFQFRSVEGGVEVTWTMDSALPFFMFFMKNTMIAVIGMDYQRGLLRLKARIETGSVPSKLSFGEKKFGPVRYLGIVSECSTEEIGPSMESGLGKMHAMLSETGIEPLGPPLAIYNKFDIVKGITRYTLAVPVPEPTEAPAGFVTGLIPEIFTYTVTHTGPYHHLHNAWAAGMMRSRSKVFKARKDMPPFEVYESDPQLVPEDEIVTTVYFPAKES